MDRQNIKSILQDALEDQIPASEINLIPAVQSQLVVGKKSLLQQGENTNKIGTKRWMLSALIVIAVLTLALITPQGRAWAQEVAQFFKRINSTTVQLSDEQLKQMNEINKSYDLPLVPVFIPPVSPEMAAISGCETPQKSQSYHCQVALAESKLGFDLKELPQKPNDWGFQYLYFNTDSRSAVMSYELDIRHISGTSYSSLVLTQGMGDISKSKWFGSNPWDVVPADKVEPIAVGAYKGEYVKGGFGLPPGANTLTWFEADRQRLAWTDGTRWYLIEFSPNLNVVGTMGRDELIHLAESLVNSSAETIEPLNPAHLTSISDAEEISGLDLKAPTLLPMNVNFSHASYFRDGKEIRLIYGDNEELIIQEQEGKPIHYTFPVVKINGEDAYFDTTEGSEVHSFLWWHKDGLNYQMDFNQSFGWHIDKEKMISIAESLQDIDDFRKKSGGNYEQVVLYEQALGIDAKHFLQAPAGWQFSYFWGEPYTQCIGLIYTSTTRQGTLFINQCKKDGRSNTPTFPLNSIEQVKVRNAKGQYVVGDFALADNGKQIWDSTLPVKQLYWQEDKLWIQMTIYEESAVLSTKEDLISLAESLR